MKRGWFTSTWNKKVTWKKNNEDFYQSKIAIKEGDAVYVVEKNRVSRAPSVKSEIKTLLPVRPSIDSNQ